MTYISHKISARILPSLRSASDVQGFDRSKVFTLETTLTSSVKSVKINAC